jgi:hypothetical protein
VIFELLSVEYALDAACLYEKDYWGDSANRVEDVTEPVGKQRIKEWEVDEVD